MRDKQARRIEQVSGGHKQARRIEQISMRA